MSYRAILASWSQAAIHIHKAGTGFKDSKALMCLLVHTAPATADRGAVYRGNDGLALTFVPYTIILSLEMGDCNLWHH